MGVNQTDNAIYKYIKLSTILLAGLCSFLSSPTLSSAETQNQSQTILYEVKPGDTLFSSARSFDKEVSDITALNSLQEDDTIHPGQILVIQGTANELSELKSTYSNHEFIEVIGNHASSIAQDYGLYASVMASQAALESNYGKSSLAAPPIHNLYGIKGGHNEDTVVMSTSEFIDGQWIHPEESFKKYPNYAESMQDNARLLRNGNSWAPEYYAGTWVENSDSYVDATNSLKGRYATDPNYDQKLEGIIDEYDLTKYDEEYNPSPSANETHEVSSGDTLYNIANRYQMSVPELQNMNGLSDHTIRLGQSLQVRATKQTSDNTSTHTVSSGDTLYNISNRYNMSVTELQQLNQLNSNDIQLGQTLHINDGREHTVGPGDTLYNVANRYSTTVENLKNRNHLVSNKIQLGQTLIIE